MFSYVASSIGSFMSPKSTSNKRYEIPSTIGSADFESIGVDTDTNKRARRNSDSISLDTEISTPNESFCFVRSIGDDSKLKKFKVKVIKKRYIFCRTHGHPGDYTTTYKCIQHVECCHEIRVSRGLDPATGAFSFLEYHSGIHTDTIVVESRSGIHFALKDTIDAMVKAGVNPRQIINTLDNTPELSAYRKPTLIQIRSFKKTWSKTSLTRMETVLDLSTYVSRLQVTTKEKFDEMGDMDMIVLNVFDSRCRNDKGKMVHCKGFVFSCKAILGNIVAARKAQGKGMHTLQDATYKLMSSGWSLIKCGTTSICLPETVDDKVRHSFRPIVFGCVYSEAAPAFHDFNAACIAFLTLHRISVTMQSNGKLFFQCDCETFFRSAYVCSHTLACIHRTPDLNLNVNTICGKIDAKRPKGRPRKASKALSKEGPITVETIKGTHANNWVGTDIFIAGKGSGIIKEAVQTAVRGEWEWKCFIPGILDPYNGEYVILNKEALAVAVELKREVFRMAVPNGS